MYHLQLFHGNNGYANASQCYIYTYIACLVIYMQAKHTYVKVTFMISDVNFGSLRQLNTSKQRQTYFLVPKKGESDT
jgi:hypothetical protein